MNNPTPTPAEIEWANRMLTEARDWLYDCFEDAPADLTDTEVMAAVNRHYSGGWQAFIADLEDNR